MADITKAREALVERILGEDGRASPAQRRAAFNNSALPDPLGALINKVVEHAHKVTDADITAVTASGTSEDQIFEFVVCAAIGEAIRQYDTALAALDTATLKE
jgi:alkylhydroperoxidase family enzyme